MPIRCTSLPELPHEYQYDLKAVRRSYRHISEFEQDCMYIQPRHFHSCRKGIPALPFGSLIDLTTKRPYYSQYPQKLQTIGDHIRKKRLDLKLLQQDVADRLGVTESTLLNWEHNRSTPTLRYLPQVITFLEYDPFDTSPANLGDRLFKYRQNKGLSQKELAKQIGIDPSTLSRLESDQGKIFNSTMAKIKLFLQVYPE